MQDIIVNEASNTPECLRIFLAEDHGVVREGLKTFVNAQPDMTVVGEAGDGKAAIEKLWSLQEEPNTGVDVVVMDVSMPVLDGTQATEVIKRRWPLMKVLALTMHEDKSYLRSLLETGASGYVLKRSAASELVRAIRAVHQGGTYLDPALSATLVDSLIRRPMRGEVQGAELSHREEEVLRLIAQGFANKEIAVRLKISIKTVESHKARSTRKLELETRSDILRYAIKRGWLQNMN